MTSPAWADTTLNFWWQCTDCAATCADCAVQGRMRGPRIDMDWNTRVADRRHRAARRRLGVLQADHRESRLDHQRRRRVAVQTRSDIFAYGFDPADRNAMLLALAGADNLDIVIVTRAPDALSETDNAFRQNGRSGWPAHIGVAAIVTDQRSAAAAAIALLTHKAWHNIPWVALLIADQRAPIDLHSFEHVPLCLNAEPVAGTYDAIEGIEWRANAMRKGPLLTTIDKVIAQHSPPHAVDALRRQCEGTGTQFTTAPLWAAASRIEAMA